jgi:hypothetical protein
MIQRNFIMSYAIRALVASAFLMAACRAPMGPPPVGKASCVERPHCSFRYAWDEGPNDPLWKQLGCGPVFQYMNGHSAGILGGNGSFCPDSTSNRKVLHDNHKRGYLPGYCETCLGVPDGQIFVFWSQTIGPSCPSGCVPGEAAPAI